MTLHLDVMSEYVEENSGMKPRGADTVVINIASEIITGRFPAGGFLPTEQVLGERCEVSRMVVREALARLAGFGLIEDRHRLGDVVLELQCWRGIETDLLQIRTEAGLIDDLLPDLFEVRRMGGSWGSSSAPPASVHWRTWRSGDITEQQAGLGEPESYNAAGIAFHDALIEASGNQVLRVLIAPISQVWRIGSTVNMRSDQEVVTYSVQGHEEIFAAIEARDPVTARRDEPPPGPL